MAKPAKDTPEIKALKAELRRRGVDFHPRHGEATLKKLLSESEVSSNGVQTQERQTERQVIHENQSQKVQEQKSYTQPYDGQGQEKGYDDAGSNGSQRQEYDELKLLPGEKLTLTEKEFKAGQVADRRKEANRLVRCRITCMNPLKKNWTGEIISVGSAKLGTYKKYIPFNSSEPYHIPYIIYQEMKERKCRIGHIVKLPNGQEVNRYKLVPEFSIEILPPLTQAELKELARRQALASGSAVAA